MSRVREAWDMHVSKLETSGSFRGQTTVCQRINLCQYDSRCSSQHLVTDQNRCGSKYKNFVITKQDLYKVNYVKYVELLSTVTISQNENKELMPYNCELLFRKIILSIKAVVKH
jgi:hypothetical protein